MPLNSSRKCKPGCKCKRHEATWKKPHRNKGPHSQEHRENIGKAIKETALKKKEAKVKQWLAGEIPGGNDHGLHSFAREYIIKLKGEACEKCGWNEIHPKLGIVPVECHHINGQGDHSFESIELLCPNCHSLTSNFRNIKQLAPLDKSV